MSIVILVVLCLDHLLEGVNGCFKYELASLWDIFHTSVVVVGTICRV